MNPHLIRPVTAIPDPHIVRASDCPDVTYSRAMVTRFDTVVIIQSVPQHVTSRARLQAVHNVHLALCTPWSSAMSDFRSQTREIPGWPELDELLSLISDARHTGRIEATAKRISEASTICRDARITVHPNHATMLHVQLGNVSGGISDGFIYALPPCRSVRDTPYDLSGRGIWDDLKTAIDAHYAARWKV